MPPPPADLWESHDHIVDSADQSDLVTGNLTIVAENGGNQRACIHKILFLESLGHVLKLGIAPFQGFPVGPIFLPAGQEYMCVF